MLRVLLGLVASALIVAACGSGGDPPTATQTQTSERAPREASLLQDEQAQQQSVDAQTESQVQQSDPQQTQPATEEVEPQQPAQQQAQQQTQQQTQQSAATTLPVDPVGVHKGVRSQGTSLGLADAPVLIEHFGDFT